MPQSAASKVGADGFRVRLEEIFEVVDSPLISGIVVF